MSNTPETLKEAGIIVGEATSNEFYFASEMESYPIRWEYLQVNSREIIEGKVKDVRVLAQVERIVSASQALSKDEDLEALRRIRAAELHDVRTWGKARILGYLSGNVGDGSLRILLPRRAMMPGLPIYVAPASMLREFYSFPEEDGLLIGSLITRPDVPVNISASGFRRHVAIIAQTGAGKSYCAGVIIEELLKKGATVIVIDPHADYVFLPMSRSDTRHSLSDRIAIFRNPSSTGRYRDRDIGGVKPYTIAFTELDVDEICEIAGIKEGYTKIREAVRHALERLRSQNRHYSPSDLLETLHEISRLEPVEDKKLKELREGAASAAKYVRNVNRLRVFGSSTTPSSSFLKPMHVSVVDLSGLEERSLDYVASKILNETYDAVSTGKYEYPVFVFLEEAHKLIPAQGSTFSFMIVNKIAAEGRKFGLFLILISQRPSKINSDSLSQCNSQIIMKMTNPQDQEAIEASSEKMSRDLIQDLPGLNPGEAVVVGDITKVPVMLQVRRRTTREGGADIDVVEALRGAIHQTKVVGIVAKDLNTSIVEDGIRSKV